MIHLAILLIATFSVATFAIAGALEVLKKSNFNFTQSGQTVFLFAQNVFAQHQMVSQQDVDVLLDVQVEQVCLSGEILVVHQRKLSIVNNFQDILYENKNNQFNVSNILPIKDMKRRTKSPSNFIFKFS